MLLLPLLLLLGLMLLPQAASQCFSGTVVATGCSCWSGFTGSTCNILSNGTCSIPAAAPLVTVPTGEFLSRFSFQFHHLIHRGLTCSSPHPQTAPTLPNFSKGFNTTNCTDTFIANIPFPDIATDCNFAQTNDAMNNYYTGSLAASLVEPIGVFRGISLSRLISNSLTMELVIPRVINLNVTNLLVYTQIEVNSAVTYQEYDATTNFVIPQSFRSLIISLILPSLLRLLAAHLISPPILTSL